MRESDVILTSRTMGRKSGQRVKPQVGEQLEPVKADAGVCKV